MDFKNVGLHKLKQIFKYALMVIKLMFRILTTQEFDKDFKKLSSQEQERVNKMLKQLKEQGGGIGKPLSGLSFFREKKFDGKRLYYLVYNDSFVILAIAISDKKAQQSTINRILLDLAEYQQHIYDLLRNK